ncbi:hypothetical protein [Lentzea flaviverrucosa]|uniref:hypothetical protein n=1 Tax=Lentzea flaviverrucosa TaxID=200379 RepID=UPI000B7D7094|nr:hypothetical protein [Lentzea flaviverrucosa]
MPPVHAEPVDRLEQWLLGHLTGRDQQPHAVAVHQITLALAVLTQGLELIRRTREPHVLHPAPVVQIDTVPASWFHDTSMGPKPDIRRVVAQSKPTRAACVGFGGELREFNRETDHVHR